MKFIIPVVVVVVVADAVAEVEAVAEARPKLLPDINVEWQMSNQGADAPSYTTRYIRCRQRERWGAREREGETRKGGCEGEWKRKEVRGVRKESKGGGRESV